MLVPPRPPIPAEPATNAAAAEYLLLLYAHARLLEDKLVAIAGWVEDARAVVGPDR